MNLYIESKSACWCRRCRSVQIEGRDEEVDDGSCRFRKVVVKRTMT